MENGKKHNERRQPAPSRVVCMMTALLTALGLQGQTAAPNRSQLVIGIVVEGLSDEYLTALEPHFTEGGFKRLMRGGLMMTDVDFGPGIDPAAGAAIIATGTSPMVNGVPARYVYSPSANRATPIMLDSRCIGNFTDETYSPRALKVSTIADELRIDSDGDGMVYALGADPQIAVITGGHSANGAYWIYDHTGNWASSSFYRDMPSSVTNRNYRTPLYSRLDTMKWVPALNMNAYPLLSRSERAKPFRHQYPSKQFDRFVQFKWTPLANREVTDMGIDLITGAKLGRDDATDMINLAYTVSPASGSRAEVMDMYIRLDRDLARLFEAADRAAGTGNTTIFLSGIPGDGTSEPYEEKWNVPTGEYSVRKALSLLELYLMGAHGNGDWVTGYFDKQFFLNRKLITDRNLNLADFRTEVADFLARMAGVCNVYTIDDIIAGRAGETPQALKRNKSVEHCGDVMIEINPGWIITDEENLTPTAGARHKKPARAERMSATRIPAFILAPGVKPQRINTRVDARAIAPAVARVLRIRSPNAASVATIPVE